MVDSRLLQANERTLLAWVRTSVSLMTFGFVIAKIGVWLRQVNPHPELHASPQTGTAWVGGAFMVLGVVADILAVTRYSLARRAIMEGKQIGAGPLPAVLAVMVALFGIVISVYLLRRLV